jgi:hypothetical protein
MSSVTTLTYLQEKPLAISGDPVVVTVVRNETMRLPFFLTHYRKLGFRQFVFIDNASTDGTREYLLKQPDCFVLTTDASFGGSSWGMNWAHTVLDRYCEGRWALVVDADELLLWPGCEHGTIQGFTRNLESIGATSLFTIMLDMYSDRPFGEIGYVPGEPFSDYCPLFDIGPYAMLEAKAFPYRQLYGGVRGRLFKDSNAGINPPTVSKVPLVKWKQGQRFVLVTHALLSDMVLAPMRGALLHFKMFDDLPEKCRIEVERKEHYEGGREYLALGRAIELSKDGTFFAPGISARYEDTAQLVALNLMSETNPFAASERAAAVG